MEIIFNNKHLLCNIGDKIKYKTFSLRLVTENLGIL